MPEITAMVDKWMAAACLFLLSLLAGNLSALETNVIIPTNWVDLPKEDFRIKDGFRLPIHVTEPSGVSRDAWPVTTGVPLPKGVIVSADQCRLTDETGHELPLQSRTLAHWPDKSVKWLLLDFQLTLKANEQRRLWLIVGPSDPDSWFERKLCHSACHATPIRLTAIPNGTRVDTGVLTFDVLSNRFSFLENAAISGQVISERGEAFVELRDRQTNSAAQRGGEYLASRAKDLKVIWEERGPLRAVVKISGWHVSADGRKAMPMILRLETYAGKSYVRVYHSFIMSEKPGDVSIPRMGLALNLAGRGTPGRVCLGSEQAEALTSVAWILHDNWNHCRIHPAVGALREETGPLRWLDYSGLKGGVAVLVRDMEKHYPKELKVDPASNAVINYIWPADLGQDMDMRVELLNPSPGMLEYKAKYPDRWRMSEHGGVTPEEAAKEGYGAKGQGVAKTHEFFYYFHQGDAGKAASAGTCRAFNDPLLGFVTPQWYSFTEAIGRFHPYDPTNFPVLEQYMSRHLNWVIKHQREWSLWYGMFDYGDTQSQRTDVPGQWSYYVDRYAWLNTEAYVDNAVWMQYLRTGKREYYDFAEAMERHHMDVDTIHYEEKPGQTSVFQEIRPQIPLGQIKVAPSSEEINFVGGSLRHNINHWGDPGAPTEEQTWNDGEMAYYYLSGYCRALDVARLHADFGIGTVVAQAWENGCANRGPVNSWISVMRAWEATGDNYYKTIADKAAAGYRRFQLPDGKWPDSVPAQFSYMGHAVAEWYYLTGNEDCRQIMLNMHAQVSGVGETDCDNSAAFPAYQYWLTHAPVYLVPGYIEIMSKSWPRFKTDELGIEDFQHCRLCMLTGLPYFMAALYDSRAAVSRFLPRVRYRDYLPDDPVTPLTNAQFQVVDLSGVGNANPYANTFHFKDENPVPDLTAYLKEHAFRPLSAGEIGFQFGMAHGPRVPGYILATARAKYPFSEDTPCGGSIPTLYGPPYGAVATYCGIPFALANNDAGSAVIVLDKNQKVRIPVNTVAQRVHFLGHVHCRSSYAAFDSMRDGLVAKYIIHYAGGKEQVIDSRNNHEIEDMLSKTYADKARMAYIGPGRMHLNIFSCDLLPEPVESIEVVEMGSGLNPVLLAVTLEGRAFPAPPAYLRKFIFKPLPSGKTESDQKIQYVDFNTLYNEQTTFGWVKHEGLSNDGGLQGEHRLRLALSNGLYELRLNLPNQLQWNVGPLDVIVNGHALVQNSLIRSTDLTVPAKIEQGRLDLVLRFPSGVLPQAALDSLEIAPARHGLSLPNTESTWRQRVQFGWDKAARFIEDTARLIRLDDTADESATFAVDLPDGHYTCELRLAACWDQHPLAVDIFAEDLPVAIAIPLQGKFGTSKFDADVKDGRLDIRIAMNKEKTRSRAPRWTIQSLIITPKT
jgi:hypothetical protein